MGMLGRDGCRLHTRLKGEERLHAQTHIWGRKESRSVQCQWRRTLLASSVPTGFANPSTQPFVKIAQISHRQLATYKGLIKLNKIGVLIE